MAIVCANYSRLFVVPASRILVAIVVKEAVFKASLEHS